MLKLDLGGSRQDARLARRFLAEVLPRLGWEDRLDDADLMVSELIANVALHARSACTVTIVATDSTLRVDVADASPVLPQLRNFSIDATTGRGIRLIDTLAESWGAEPGPEGGKTVWFCMGRPVRERSNADVGSRAVHPSAPVRDFDALLASFGGPDDDDEWAPKLSGSGSVRWS